MPTKKKDIQDRRNDKRSKQIPLPRELQLEIRDKLPRLQLPQPEARHVRQVYRGVEQFHQLPENQEFQLVKNRATPQPGLPGTPATRVFELPGTYHTVNGGDILPDERIYRKFSQMFPPHAEAPSDCSQQ